MMLNLFTNTTAVRTRKPKAHRALLALEGLEDRTVMSHMMAAPVQPVAQVATTPKVTTSLPLTFTGASVQQVSTDTAGAITSVTGTAIASLAGHTVPVPFTLTPTTTNGAVTILDLRINPIHLDLLGLKVDTSAICLKITAQPGPGNLLGNLLSGVANLLNGPSTLTSPLTSLLNGALSQPAKPTVTGTTPGATNVLNLSVGPVDLNLLGLDVRLDNCNNGPVTVSITAQPGPGNLLGNLISSLSHLLDNPGNPVGGILTQLGLISGIVRNAPVV